MPRESWMTLTLLLPGTCQYIQKQTALLNNFNPENRDHSSWQIVREFTSSNSVPFSKISGGRTEERLNIWFQHLESLLGSDPPTPDLSSSFFNQQISESLPISWAVAWSLWFLRTRFFLKSPNSSKFPGRDSIFPSIWKLSFLFEDRLGFCYEALLCDKVLDAWTTASIIPIPK